MLSLGSIHSVQSTPLVVPLDRLPRTLTRLSLLKAIIVSDPAASEVEGVSIKEDGAVPTGGLPPGLHYLQLKWCDWRLPGDEAPELGAGLSDLHAMMASIADCRNLTELVLILGWPIDGFKNQCLKLDPGDSNAGHLEGGVFQGLSLRRLTNLPYLSHFDLQIVDFPESYPFADLICQLSELSSLRGLRLRVQGRSSWCEPCRGESQGSSMQVGQNTRNVPTNPGQLFQEGQMPCPEAETLSDPVDMERLAITNSDMFPFILLRLTCLSGLQSLHLEPLTMPVARLIKEDLILGLPNCR